MAENFGEKNVITFYLQREVVDLIVFTLSNIMGKKGKQVYTHTQSTEIWRCMQKQGGIEVHYS